MSPIKDHPMRYKLANELHARPFPMLSAPGQAIFLALTRRPTETGHDAAADHEHLLALLNRHGTSPPPPEATHFSGKIGRHYLKWESHSEFVTYTVLIKGEAKRPFDPAAFDVFPDSWLDEAPGERITSAMIHLSMIPEDEELTNHLQDWFVAESLAVSRVLDGAAVTAADFRIDEAGHMRFAVFAAPDAGDRRIGRIIQRLCEIETYKTMSMLGFAQARALTGPLNEIDSTLSALTEEMVNETALPEETLGALMPVSAEIEKRMAQSSYRFAATAAYSAIVNQRVSVLREERFQGRQTFAEFMMRRFDPAMRTVQATNKRLQNMSKRALRVADLLRTRVDVDRSAQNQALLESMDRRADLQLRLQRTVEGLSVVAISYYGVNLAANFLAPFGESAGIEKPVLTAALVPVVLITVWSIIRQIRKSMH